MHSCNIFFLGMIPELKKTYFGAFFLGNRVSVVVSPTFRQQQQQNVFVFARYSVNTSGTRGGGVYNIGTIQDYVESTSDTTDRLANGLSCMLSCGIFVGCFVCTAVSVAFFV